MNIQRLLIVGDSISSHRPCVEKLGWSGSWGMAASSEENDYVHLFLSRLAESQAGLIPELMLAGGGGGKLSDKLTQRKELASFAADVAVVQLGENDNDDVSRAGFESAYEEIVRAILSGNPRTRVFCFSVWAPPSGSPVKDEMIRSVCQRTGSTFVNLDAIIADPRCKAEAENRFWHAGVNWHPGDEGMRGYAEALWKAFCGEAAIPPLLSIKERQEPRIEIVHHWTPNATSIELPAEKIRGRRLTVELRPSPLWSKESISSARLDLELEDAEAQVVMIDGVFEYHSDNEGAYWSRTMPDNLIRAQIALRAISENTGLLWIRSSEK